MLHSVYPVPLLQYCLRFSVCLHCRLIFGGVMEDRKSGAVCF
uniref:Uncharacterized protein n=1 Tax=Anguilla anguilla TaxID=7936 RepID=A0A0E9VY63_ANGAN